MSNEILYIPMENLSSVLEQFVTTCFKTDILGTVSLEEIKELFLERVAHNDHHCEISDEHMMQFLEFIGKIAADRALASLVEKDLVDYKHDGDDFVFELKNG